MGHDSAPRRQSARVAAKHSLRSSPPAALQEAGDIVMTESPQVPTTPVPEEHGESAGQSSRVELNPDEGTNPGELPTP